MKTDKNLEYFITSAVMDVLRNNKEAAAIIEKIIDDKARINEWQDFFLKVKCGDYIRYKGDICVVHVLHANSFHKALSVNILGEDKTIIISYDLPCKDIRW